MPSPYRTPARKTRVGWTLALLLPAWTACGGTPARGGAAPNPDPSTTEASVEEGEEESGEAAAGDGHPYHDAAEHPHHHGQGMQHSFSDVDRFARIFDDPGRGVWQKPEEVVALLDLEPGATVVDLGAGTGYFVDLLAETVGDGGRVWALDVEPNMVEHMRERFRDQGPEPVIRVRLCAPDNPELGEETVDRILIVDTWHHISDRPAYGQKLRRSLRPGGAVLIVDFTLETDRGPPRRHRLPAATVVEELRAAGFDEVAILEETLPDQYAVRAR